jgi:hypothetical protein
VAEEVQFVMSHIDLLSEKKSGTKKRKTEVPTAAYKHLQIFLRKEASSFLEHQLHLVYSSQLMAMGHSVPQNEK